MADLARFNSRMSVAPIPQLAAAGTRRFLANVCAAAWDHSAIRLVHCPSHAPDFAIAWACLAEGSTTFKTRVASALDDLHLDRLGNDEVWLLLATPGQSVHPAVVANLSDEEKGRADRFRFAEDRQSYLAAHILLRAGLSQLSGCSPRSHAFASRKSGKPVLDDRCPAASRLRGFHFNLSHTRGMVAVAFARHAIGVDVEKVRPITDMRELVIELMSDAALRRFDEAPGDAARLRLFMRYWTLSEAFLKASGEGLSGTTRSLDFSAQGTPRLTGRAARVYHDVQLGCAHGETIDWQGAAAARKNR